MSESSYVSQGSVRASINAGVLTTTARQGIIVSITRIAVGAFEILINTPVDMNRLRLSWFYFLDQPSPPIPLFFSQWMPLSGDASALAEDIGFTLFTFDQDGALNDPPDLTNIFVIIEQSPY